MLLQVPGLRPTATCKESRSLLCHMISLPCQKYHAHYFPGTCGIAMQISLEHPVDCASDSRESFALLISMPNAQPGENTDAAQG